MPTPDLAVLRDLLQKFDFRAVFVDVLGWNRDAAKIPPVDVDGVIYQFAPLAEQGVRIIEVTAADGNIPASSARARIEKHLAPFAVEPILIYVDGTRNASLWWWRGVKTDGKSGSPRWLDFRKGQSVEGMLQRLPDMAVQFKELDASGHAPITDVSARVRSVFDIERVTKTFYDKFKVEHTNFERFLDGISDQGQRAWYISIVLNRLMFLYFIQAKRLLDRNPHYLQDKLKKYQADSTTKDRFYRDFLCPLFFEGLALDQASRTVEVNAKLGHIPYLNGGLFLPHAIEDANPDIQIADEAFARLFAFFNDWSWHLDDRPLRAGNEINPDVLGFIFEKYINQKQMGAYYTKEDITGYICKNTILPYLLEAANVQTRAVMRDVEPYLYDAVKTLDRLPTETDREYAARQARVIQIKADFAAGKLASINDLITYNLNIVLFAEDWLRALTDPAALHAFYFGQLKPLSVLDPTCGSGAFLFAAMNILEPLYELCLDKMPRMVTYLAGMAGDPAYDAARLEPIRADLSAELTRLAEHPNRRYFVFKSIIVNNLFGVDIMDEAAEICKLRLFLKLAAQVEDPERIEPLPDIDFNIRAGNTLVGFATRAEIDGNMFARPTLPRIEALAGTLETFRAQQLQTGVTPLQMKTLKKSARAAQTEIAAVLDQALGNEYGRDAKTLPAFRASHKPFHWYAEFNQIVARGGFDVIVGNPPYVEYSKVKKEYTIRDYKTENSDNLYAYTMERAAILQKDCGRFGVIVPVGAFSVAETTSLRALLTNHFKAAWVSSYAIRPAKLFEGVDQRLAIYLGAKNIYAQQNKVFTSDYYHWYSEERTKLFSTLVYQDVTALGRNNIYPKISNDLAYNIITKVTQIGIPASIYLHQNNGVKLYYHRSPRYWIRTIDFEPHFKSATRTKSIFHVRELTAINSEAAKFLGAVFNSSLFFFWFLAVGNGRNLTGDDVKGFCVGKPSANTLASIGKPFDKLMSDYQKNSFIRKRKDQEFQEFNISASKPIIDEIDRVLAQHYGFSDAELDFIINYDIKYRMGAAVAESEDDE